MSDEWRALHERLSKNTVERLCSRMKDNPDALNEAIGLLEDTDIRYRSVAAWVLKTYAVDKKYGLSPDHCKRVLKRFMKEQESDMVTRSALQMMLRLGIPEEYEGSIYDRCMENVRSKPSIAVTAFSIRILNQMVSKYPDLGHEYRDFLESVPDESPGVRVAKRDGLRILDTLQPN